MTGIVLEQEPVTLNNDYRGREKGSRNIEKKPSKKGNGEQSQKATFQQSVNCIGFFFANDCRSTEVESYSSTLKDKTFISKIFVGIWVSQRLCK